VFLLQLNVILTWKNAVHVITDAGKGKILNKNASLINLMPMGKLVYTIKDILVKVIKQKGKTKINSVGIVSSQPSYDYF
jgi:hypothetical protein